MLQRNEISTVALECYSTQGLFPIFVQVLYFSMLLPLLYVSSYYFRTPNLCVLSDSLDTPVFWFSAIHNKGIYLFLDAGDKHLY